MPRLVHFSRGLLLAGGLLASTLAVRAEDEPKKPADDSITANRKELEALRAESSLGAAPDKLGISAGLEMPGLSVGSASPAPAPNPEAKDPAALPLKSSGWLIDGMEKARNETGRDAGKNGRTGENELRDRKDLENSRTNPKDRLNPSDGSDRESAQENGRDVSRELKPGEKVANPLTGYMASWMTSGDFDLLQKPAAGAGGAFAKALPDFTTPGTGGLGLNAPSGLSDTAAGTVGFVGAGPSAVPENPYLQALTGSPTPTAGKGTELTSRQVIEPIPVGAAPLPAWLSPPTPEPSRISPLVPDNLKPSDDAKYFPQLKRF